MTNRERVIAALNFEKPDFIPYNIRFTGQMLEKMINYTSNHDYLHTINNHISEANLNKPQIQIKPGFDMDEYGVIWNKTGADKDIGVVDELILKEIEDLNSFSLPPVDEAYIRNSVETMITNAGENFRIADIGFSLFERAWTLRGMQNLLCDMIEEPEFVHALLDKITERNLKIMDIVLEYDIDCFYFGDDWGQQKGLIMGPKCWNTFIKPRLAKLYARAHRAGKYVVQHSCGDIREIMDDLYDIGLNMYQTFQPEIYGYGYAQKLKGKITIWGGISTQRDLPVKSPEKIKMVTREMMSFFPDGGLVAAPAHDVPGDVPAENILAMLAVLENQ